MTHKNKIEQDSRHLIKKNVLLRAGYNMTSHQQLILYLAISKVDMNKDVSPDDFYTVSTADFAAAAGYRDNAHAFRDLVKKARELQTKVVYLPNPNSPSGNLEDDRESYSWVPAVRPFTVGNKGRDYSGVEVNFNKFVCPYLTFIKDESIGDYTKTPMARLFKLKSFYSRRFYQYFYSLKYKCRNKEYLEIEYMRDIFNLDDKVTKKSIHPQIGSFKKYVIDVAVDEINEKLDDLSLSYEPVKVGRKVTGYEFTYNFKTAKPLIKKQAQPAKEIEGGEVKESSAAKRMREGAEKVKADQEAAEMDKIKQKLLAMGYGDDEVAALAEIMSKGAR